MLMAEIYWSERRFKHDEKSLVFFVGNIPNPPNNDHMGPTNLWKKEYHRRFRVWRDMFVPGGQWSPKAANETCKKKTHTQPWLMTNIQKVHGL